MRVEPRQDQQQEIAVEALYSLSQEESGKYETRDDNLFTVSLAQLVRYRQFLAIIIGRYESTIHAWRSSLDEIQTEFELKSRSQPGSSSMTDAELAAWMKNSELTTRLHLEIESFYVFAKILLDKTALFIQNYFGQEQGCSLASHHKFSKCWKRYGQLKGLVYPEGLPRSLSLLQEQICNFRDKQISHLQNLRTLKPTLYSLADTYDVRLGLTYIPPRERDSERPPVESVALHQLLEEVDTYTGHVIDLVRKNRQKTRLALKQ
jgi:hypothetical protein